ncbi:uncharacterized protein ACA1_342880 [Acanthamoeba castellanii str. Neff]|uniref:Uncharacterized protein n=1 Tax=Acanthamoeba castellanii (strain ATCC 30010 / Neff) TaxID=1257118 RepID=L8HCB4_ACACF|nr:uncharacterized protein ACA1_342880 [Acanthamoeba castellanii str. Neff]ELR23154.1 hypothetical protein ACA1_342880 [Acanthamoeba castellanii str. Neff]
MEKDMEYVYRTLDMDQGKQLEAKINKLVKSLLMYNLNIKITGFFPIVREEWPYTLDILDWKGIDKPQFLGELCGLGALEMTNKAKAWWGGKMEMMCQVDRDDYNDELEWQGDILHFTYMPQHIEVDKVSFSIHSNGLLQGKGMENVHLKAYLKKVMAEKKKRQEELTATVKTSAQ